MASLNAVMSPIGTSGAIFPPLNSSLGPLGQSVLTTGVPNARASVRVFGDPSHLDDKTKTAARRIHAHGLSVKPGNATLSAMPNCRACSSRASRSWPSPKIISLASRCFATSAKACSQVGKSFCSVNRPTPSTTGSASFASHGCSTGSVAAASIAGLTVGLRTTVT